MFASLHKADSNSTVVNNFSVDKGDVNNFATVAIQDADGNSVTLFFASLAEVKNFALMVEQGIRKANK
jgi:hypothetical protein